MSTIRQTLMVVAFAVVGMCGAGTSQAAERPVSFVRDIMPMLTRLGCNTTACHNVLQGKGGLKLSPLGSDFNHDFNALARSESGRRVSTIDPDNSLLLKRLTSPESTVKLTPDSEAYRRFHAWMAAGAPGPSDSDPHVVDNLASFVMCRSDADLLPHRRVGLFRAPVQPRFDNAARCERC